MNWAKPGFPVSHADVLRNVEGRTLLSGMVWGTLLNGSVDHHADIVSGWISDHNAPGGAQSLGLSKWGQVVDPGNDAGDFLEWDDDSVIDPILAKVTTEWSILVHMTSFEESVVYRGICGVSRGTGFNQFSLLHGSNSPGDLRTYGNYSGGVMDQPLDTINIALNEDVWILLTHGQGEIRAEWYYGDGRFGNVQSDTSNPRIGEAIVGDKPAGLSGNKPWIGTNPGNAGASPGLWSSAFIFSEYISQERFAAIMRGSPYRMFYNYRMFGWEEIPRTTRTKIRQGVR